MHNVINRIDELVGMATPPTQTKMHRELRATIGLFEEMVKQGELEKNRPLKPYMEDDCQRLPQALRCDYCKAMEIHKAKMEVSQ